MNLVSCTKTTLKTAAVALALLAGGTAMADGRWPQRSVRLIVPATAGGSADTVARRIAFELEGALKQPFVVENMPGAGSLIGAQAVVRQPPDGYTLLVHGVGGHLIRTPENPNALDPAKDFTHIAFLGGVPVVFAVNNADPITDIQSLAAFSKTLPGGMSWGSPGLGTRSYIIGEQFRDTFGAHMVHVPYKGASPVITDLMGGRLGLAVMTLNSAKSMIDARKVRPIAVSSAQRIPTMAQVPTFLELGYPKLTGSSWFGISGPHGMPADIVRQINEAVNRALRAPEVSKALAENSFEARFMSAGEFTRFFLEEITLLTPYMQ